ncbi:hypothetical protein BRADI_1g38748v3 [Brachypodium distachyon]|uniref:Uncharacterized protein n=1 Tax=Brachypodium distachyon TaxID=15368 RepID=A0A2K2DNI3_BRADI|nr:hypothetical protein BRADI_1g38748v3 [Brachypodium distachyon]
MEEDFGRREGPSFVSGRQMDDAVPLSTACPGSWRWTCVEADRANLCAQSWMRRLRYSKPGPSES